MDEFGKQVPDTLMFAVSVFGVALIAVALA